jgi:ribosomal protein S18 acetylase RimI-like enzyme
VVPVEIRSMREQDLPGVVSIQEAITQRPVNQSWLASLKEQLGKESCRCLVAIDNGGVAGFLLGEIKYGAFGEDKTGWLGYIGVAPKKMGRGIGRSLAYRLLEIFKQEGVEDVHTSVRWDSVDMLSFFKSLGFDRSNFINLRKRLT